MDEKEKILYQILFGEETDLVFEITSLLDFIEDYNEVLETIVKGANKGKVIIIKDVIEVKGDNIFWNLKIKRK